MTRSAYVLPSSRARRHGLRGMTLIELLVAMVIGLGVTLAVSSLVVVGENHKRTTTSTNDAEQSGAYAFYILDRALRSAGSGIAESAYPTDRGVLGCKLSVAAAGATILPRPGAFPAPFSTAFLAGATANLRVAPVLIAKNQSDTNSDVLVVMGGSGAAGGVSRQVVGSGSATTVVLDNSVGFATSDLGLVSQPGTTDCLLEEITSLASSPTLTLATTGTYYTATGASTTLSTLTTSTSSYFTPLGNAAANNLQFLLFGVGSGRTLYSYDLLQNIKWVQSSGGDTAQAIADGVDRMYAIYGLDTNADGLQDTWVNPDVASGYDIGTVMTSATLMRQIVSVRVALVMRGSYYDKNPVSPTTLALFSGLTTTVAGGTALPRNVTLTATDQHYRYRVFEFTVPLRNMLLLAGAPPPT